VLAVDAKVTPFSSAVVGVRGCGSGRAGRAGRGRVAARVKRWVGQRTVVKRRNLRQGCNS